MQIALSWVRQNSVMLRIESPVAKLETHDIHIHMPEGAVPKDGPSAGRLHTSISLPLTEQLRIGPHDNDTTPDGFRQEPFRVRWTALSQGSKPLKSIPKVNRIIRASTY